MARSPASSTAGSDMEKIHVEEHGRPERCPYCHGDIGSRSLWRCPGCDTPHHAECAKENGGCTILGCRRSFSGSGVAPQRPGRQLPPRGSPRRDFWIGLAFLVAGLGVLAATIRSGADPIAIWYYGSLGPVGILLMVYALRRARRENRWAE